MDGERVNQISHISSQPLPRPNNWHRYSRSFANIVGHAIKQSLELLWYKELKEARAISGGYCDKSRERDMESLLKHTLARVQK